MWVRGRQKTGLFCGAKFCRENKAKEACVGVGQRKGRDTAHRLPVRGRPDLRNSTETGKQGEE